MATPDGDTFVSGIQRVGTTAGLVTGRSRALIFGSASGFTVTVVDDVITGPDGSSIEGYFLVGLPALAGFVVDPGTGAITIGGESTPLVEIVVGGIRFGADGTFTVLLSADGNTNLSVSDVGVQIDAAVNFRVDIAGTPALEVTAGKLLVSGALAFDTPIAEPATPASGFVIWLDDGDGKLKAKGDSGTVTPLADP